MSRKNCTGRKLYRPVTKIVPGGIILVAKSVPALPEVGSGKGPLALTS